MITVYSKPGCPPCINLKVWLASKKLEYKEEPLAEHMDKILGMGFVGGAPVVQVNETYAAGANIGYVREVIERELGYAL